MKLRPLLALLLAAPLFFVSSTQAQAPQLSDEPYPGTLTLAVDATDTARRIFRVEEEIPVSAGPLSLHYPQWLPGNHGPTGPIEQLAGLSFSVDGKALPWQRDPEDMYTVNVQIPAGATRLKAQFQFLSPLDGSQGRVVVTPEIIGLQWNAVVLYPAGYAARKIQVQPSLKLPEGWQFGSALQVRKQIGASTDFEPVSLETLVDSPLFAGKYFQRFDLDAGGKLPVHLNVVADTPQQLQAKPEILASHRALVQQAYRLFGSAHYARYDFLLALSDRFSGIGLEHHQSSENGTDSDYLTNPDLIAGRELLAHEYTHSWNGKFRRPADLWTPHYNTPMRNSLLWVYEGQTQYWGAVLAARSGMLSIEQTREALAMTAAAYDHREGRVWRNLQDTTNQPIIAYRRSLAWASWQRARDYYPESQLIWLDVDSLIREKSVGKRSLDDFARAFFGVENGRIEPLTYTFEDLVAALDRVQPNDWASFLRARVDGHGPGAPLDGLNRSGWKLVYTDQPNIYGRNAQQQSKSADFSYSLGLTVSRNDMRITDVLWDSPAFKAGLASSMTLVAINGLSASAQALEQAIIDAQKTGAAITLLVNNQDHIDSVRIDYRDGLRYPHLARIPGTPDRLGAILSARK